SEATACPIAAAACAIASSSGSVSPARGPDGAGGAPPRPCVRPRRGSRIVDSRKVPEVCSTRSFSSVSARETARMSDSDFAPFAASVRRSSLNVETITSFCAVTRSSIELRPPAPAIAWLAANVNSCSNGLTSRKKMSLRASREVARADVVGDDVARLDVEVLEEERVVRLDAEAPRRNRERHRLLDALDRVDEIEPRDAVVVLGFGVDVDLFEPRDLPVLRGLGHPHF